MSEALEKRLRELLAATEHLDDEDAVLDLMNSSARIGAEVEREECALLVNTYGFEHEGEAHEAAIAIVRGIRARGGK